MRINLLRKNIKGIASTNNHNNLNILIMLKCINPHVSAHLQKSHHQAVRYKGKIIHVLHTDYPPAGQSAVFYFSLLTINL
jgi:hypothetical protein